MEILLIYFTEGYFLENLLIKNFFSQVTPSFFMMYAL